MARIKTVFTNREIAHAWTRQDQEIGRTSNGNMSFDGKRFFSYSTCIAQIITSTNGESVYLINSERYSNTTANHKSQVMRAIPRGYKVFEIEVGYYPKSLDYGTETGERVYQLIEKQLSELRDKLRRARQNKPYIMRAISRMMRQSNASVDAFKLSHDRYSEDEISEIETDAGNLLCEIDAEKQKLNAVTLDQVAEKLESWKSGGAYNQSFHRLPVALRLKGDIIETSHGAIMPLKEAVRLWNFVKERKVYVPTTYKIESYRGYQLNGISDGMVYIGCHTIAVSELERIATSLKLA